MALNLSAARGNATRYANSRNWFSFIQACTNVAGLLKREGKERLARHRYMCALIYSLQGGQDYGRHEWGKPFEPDKAKTHPQATESLAALIEGESDLRDLFERVVEDKWHEDFLRSREDVWQDVNQSMKEAKIRIKRLVLKNPSEYEYPASIGAKRGEFPTDAGLRESKMSRESEYHPLNRRNAWIETIEERFESKLFNWIRDNFDCRQLDRLIVEESRKHGIFARPYFFSEIRREAINQIKRESLEKVKKRVEDSTGEDLSLFRVEYPNELIIQSIYDLTFMRSADKISKIAGEWYRDNSNQSTCEICGRHFRLIDLPHWVYRGSDGLKICCFSCPVKEIPSKEELHERIPVFVEKCGFIPKSNAGPTNPSFTSRLTDSHKLEVFRAYGKIGGMTHVVLEFGSWFRALAETNALPEGFRYSGTGVWCLAKDGHKCHSLAEQQIDNWLTHHGVKHEREPTYPHHEEYNSTGRRRADWKVGDDVLIEYFGLTGDPDYDEKAEEKILLAEECGLQLIALYPDDLDDLNTKLAQLLV